MGDAIISALSGAKEAGMAWTKVAELLNTGLERERRHGVDPEAGRFLAIAVDATGYSPNLLYRYLAVWKFAAAHLVRRLATFKELGRMPFASVELIKRVWDLDRRFAREACLQVLEGKVTVRQLQSNVRSLEAKRGAQDPRWAAYASRRKTEGHIIAAIKDHYLEILSDTKAARFVEEPGSLLRYARTDLAIVIEGHGRIEAIDAVEVKSRMSLPARSVILESVARWAINSTFYRRFWLVLSFQPNEKLVLSEIQKAIAQLSLNNIGIATATIAKTGGVALRVIRSPVGPPVPDRRTALIEALRSSMWHGLTDR